MAAIMRPVVRSLRKLKKRSLRHAVQNPDEEIFRGGIPASSRMARFAAIKSRCTRGDGGAWPGGFIVSQGSQLGSLSLSDKLVERAFEPVARIGKLRVKFRGHFGAYFVARLADAGAKRGDDVFGPGAKLHLHPPQRFCSDAMNCAAPAGVNCSDRMALRVCEQNGNAVSNLHDEQDAALARDESVALRS